MTQLANIAKIILTEHYNQSVHALAELKHNQRFTEFDSFDEFKCWVSNRLFFGYADGRAYTGFVDNDKIAVKFRARPDKNEQTEFVHFSISEH